jgi:hypothetical protein
MGKEYAEGESIKEAKVYTFRNNDFEFEFCDYIGRDDLGFSFQGAWTNYYQKLMAYKKVKIEEIISDCGIELLTKEEYSNNETQKERMFYGVYILPELNGERYCSNISFDFTFYVENYEQLKLCTQFISDIYNEIKEYMPQENSELNKGSFRIKFKTAQPYHDDANNILSINEPLTRKNINIEKFELWTKYKYAALVKEGKWNDNKIKTENVKYAILENLVIDGETITSNKYDTVFYYNIEDDQYYAVVCFGSKFDYNGGVEDYLQREIIQRYYPDCNYKIDNDKKRTTYKIGENKYEVKYKMDKSIEGLKEETENKTLVFYKDGKDMQIESFYENTGICAGATYYRFISIEDYAKIMKMEVSAIDQDTKTVYLKTT